MAKSKFGTIIKAIFAERARGNSGSSTRKVQPAHTAGPYRARGASTTGGSSVGGIPANSQPLKWNERL